MDEPVRYRQDTDGQTEEPKDAQALYEEAKQTLREEGEYYYGRMGGEAQGPEMSDAERSALIVGGYEPCMVTKREAVRNAGERVAQRGLSDSSTEMLPTAVNETNNDIPVKFRG